MNIFRLLPTTEPLLPGKRLFALTVHFVLTDFKIQSACLGCYAVSEDHAADVIRCALNEWNITEKK